jgi:putative exporter of polyketide antibiotics
MKIRNEQSFWSGVMFFVFGLAFVVLAREYGMGTAQRMGPAYFPTILGALLAALGLLIAFAAVGGEKQAHHKVEKFHFDALGWVLGAVVAFALLLRPAGLVVALVALVLISGLGSHDRNFRQLLLLTAGLVVLVLVVFIYGLGLTLPVWPAFMRN